MSANRRDFIRFVVAGAVTAGCPIDLSLVSAQTGDEKSHSAEVDGEDNHVHLLVNYPPKVAVSALVNSLKMFSDDFMEEGRRQPAMQDRGRNFP